MLIGKATHTNFIVFALNRSWLKRTIYRTLTMTPPMRLSNIWYCPLGQMNWRASLKLIEYNKTSVIAFCSNVQNCQSAQYIISNNIDPCINIAENLRGNQEWTNLRNWQYWVHKTQDEDKQQQKTHNTICVGHNSTQANTNSVNKPCSKK